ncbi:MAG TPA: carbohydrate kinase family protein [Planctomycetota bacterium]|nr:carbohydrate kinase family protein [Planctomycetota bacterium]
MSSILCIGNAGIDLIAPHGTTWPTRARAWQLVEDGLHVKAGGCGHDTAIGIAKLGVESKLIAGVGRGGHGQFVREPLERHGVVLPARCTHEAWTTPLELLVADEGGRPSALHFVGASKHVDAALLRELHGEGSLTTVLRSTSAALACCRASSDRTSRRPWSTFSPTRLVWNSVST